MPADSAVLAAIIVTYNRPVYLERCIAAVLRQTRKPDQVIVVDNCSGPETAAAIARFDDPTICVARITPNVGSAGAVNVGVAAARQLGATHVWMGDDDAYPADDCFAKQLRSLLADERDVATALVYADDNSGDLTYPWLVDGKITYDSRIVLRNGLDLVNKFPSFWGTAMAPLSLFDRLGPIKAECFIWGDEIEYSQRIKKAGLRFSIAPGAIAYHPRWKGQPDNRPPFGEFPHAPPDRLFILYRNRTMWTRDDKGFVKGLARAMIDGFYFLLAKRQPVTALKIWAYAFDGLFDTYMLAPSRTQLKQYDWTLTRRTPATAPQRTEAMTNA
jgi:GT2 family glycosyltransferase